ncbi:MAG: hypothetical protein KY464_04650 [Gemmatimonadetes bacterium]|nr:hypothetical protein [Gemmatimonadota bacterium]
MSDSSPPGRLDDTVLPPPTIYDPADDRDTPPGAEPTGTLVLLLVTDPALDWAARTAVELCASWSRSGRRIVLADLHLESPVLHDFIGGDNIDGLVDVFLYGVSITRSARPVPDRGFHLIPAGTYTPDVEEIYQNPRWTRLITGFGDAGATLVVFAPADAPAISAISRWVTEVLVLGELESPGALAPFVEAGAVVRANLVKPSLLPASRSERTVYAPLPVPPIPAPPAAEPMRDEDSELHLPPPPMRSPPRRRPIYFALWLLLGVVVLALAGYVVGRLRPDLLPWPTLLAERAGVDTTVSAISTGNAPAAALRAGAPLPYSVQVIAFQSLPAALERLNTDRERVTSAPIFLSPEEIDGIVYYKILAGALPDTTAARRLKESLVADGVVNGEDAAGSTALVQSAPLAFQLAEYPSQGAATAATDSLLARNIPAYALPMPYSDSTYRWQLYAGAYRDTASSVPMRMLLTSAGLEAALVARSGMVPLRN